MKNLKKFTTDKKKKSATETKAGAKRNLYQSRDDSNNQASAKLK